MDGMIYALPLLSLKSGAEDVVVSLEVIDIHLPIFLHRRGYIDAGGSGVSTHEESAGYVTGYGAEIRDDLRESGALHIIADHLEVPQVLQVTNAELLESIA